MKTTKKQAGKRDAAYERLRVLRPSALAAIMEDGDTRELSLSKGKGRWERALGAARALGADGLEARDEEGAIIEVIVLDEMTSARKHNGDNGERPDLDQLSVLLTLCQDFADRTAGRQQETLSQVCETAIQIMKAAADRAERSERALDKVLRAHTRLLTKGDPDSEGMNSTDLMAMFAAMMGADPASMQRLGLPGQVVADGNGGGEPMVAVPKSVIDKVMRVMDEKENDEKED